MLGPPRVLPVAAVADDGEVDLAHEPVVLGVGVAAICSLWTNPPMNSPNSIPASVGRRAITRDRRRIETCSIFARRAPTVQHAVPSDGDRRPLGPRPRPTGSGCRGSSSAMTGRMAWPCRAATGAMAPDRPGDAFAESPRGRRHEPVTVAAHPDDVADAAGALGPGSRWSAIPADDAWMRDIGPTFVVDDARRPARASTGGSTPGVASAAGSTRRGTHDDAMAAAVLAPRASTATARRSCSRAARSTPTGGHAARRPRSACSTPTATRRCRRAEVAAGSARTRARPRWSGSGSGSWTTRPTATSTTSPASSGPASWCSPGPTTATIRSTTVTRRAAPARGRGRRAGPVARGARPAPARPAAR